MQIGWLMLCYPDYLHLLKSLIVLRYNLESCD
jgi:hypothetical protein